jgi:hypothetical protein
MKGSIDQEDIKITHIFAPNKVIKKYMKKLLYFKGNNYHHEERTHRMK